MLVATISLFLASCSYDKFPLSAYELDEKYRMLLNQFHEGDILTYKDSNGNKEVFQIIGIDSQLLNKASWMNSPKCGKLWMVSYSKIQNVKRDSTGNVSEEYVNGYEPIVAVKTLFSIHIDPYNDTTFIGCHFKNDLTCRSRLAAHDASNSRVNSVIFIRQCTADISDPKIAVRITLSFQEGLIKYMNADRTIYVKVSS